MAILSHRLSILDITQMHGRIMSTEKHMNRLKSANPGRQRMIDLLLDETGQDLIEYALVAGLVALGAVVAMSGLATKIKQSFNSVGNDLTNAL
jgi:pilus assembly protein Flp/PilA